jgi:hypothetical protein
VDVLGHAAEAFGFSEREATFSVTPLKPAA